MQKCGKLLPFALFVLAFVRPARAVDAPRIVEHDGRHALLVDGAPFLVLGAQINNSSSWPSVLPQVWPALEAMHANTAEAPVYWEQLEPQPGRFDYTTVDALLQGAREHHLHLVLLWFGTWKNGNMHYVPEWVKSDTASLPSHDQRRRRADRRSLRELDTQPRCRQSTPSPRLCAISRRSTASDHTVLMIQVENESGAIGTPARLLPCLEQRVRRSRFRPICSRCTHKSRGTWQQVFGGEGR